MYIYGQITKLSKDRKSGKILITRGQDSGQEKKFNCLNVKVPVKRGSAVRMTGIFKDNVFMVNEASGIAKELTASEISMFGIPQNVIETALQAAGVNTLYDLYCASEAKYKVAETVGQDAANQLYSALNSMMRDTEVIDVYDILQKSNTALDITDAVTIADYLKYTAIRRKKTIAELILDDPWILHRIPDFDVTGMMRICNQIAEAYNITPGTKRIAGCLTGICVSNMKNGSTFIDRQTLLTRAAGYLKEPYKKISDVLYSTPHLTQERGSTIGTEDTTAVYLSPIYFMERSAVENIAHILKAPADVDLPSDQMMSYASEWEDTVDTELDDCQKSFIKAVSDHKITLLTGRAGSGKSTAIKALIHALQRMGVRYAVLAPTGIAAQRVAAETGSDFYTVHRYAGIIDDNTFDPQAYKQDKDADDVIIIDEMSMMTVSTFSALLSVIKPSARMVLAGDPAQLPPIGAGGVFDALIRSASECGIARIDLDRSYRMNDSINRIANILRDGGRLIQDSSVQIIEASAWKAAVEKTTETVTGLIASGVSYKDILVLARNRGTAKNGTVFLNQSLKQAINPTADKLGVGDPVIAVRNDYEDGWITGVPTALKERAASLRAIRANRPTIYNGTRGIITASDDKAVIIRYDTPAGEITAEYNPAELLWYIELAYAMTVHKAQGGKSRHVIFVEPEADRCSRNMLYTSLSRCSGPGITLIGSGWDSEFKVITPESRFDKKLWKTINGFIEECEEPAVQLIE
jgi:exodeoxyribonuclease V alpha subunit